MVDGVTSVDLLRLGDEHGVKRQFAVTGYIDRKFI
jgi:hypothetical protein